MKVPHTARVPDLFNTAMASLVFAPLVTVRRQTSPHRSVIGSWQLQDPGIHDARPTNQHVVELDERPNQRSTLGPRAHPALTRRVVGVGHGLGNLAKARVTP